MEYDLSESVSPRSSGAKDTENSRIQAIADELRRRCELYEAQHGNSRRHVTPFDIEQREAEQLAKDEGKFSNGNHLVWDVVPRNVLKDNEGDIYVVDAEIRQLDNTLY